MEFSLMQIVLVIGAGMASVLSPCVLPVLPIIVAGREDDHRYRPLLIVLGLSVAFMAMGVLTSLFGQMFAGKMQYAEKVAGVLIILFGLLILLDVNLFKKMSFLQKIETRSRGRWSGLFLGLTLGVVWIPCVGPMLSGILAMVAAERVVVGVVMLGFYALGFSIPMLTVAYGSQYSRKWFGGVKTHPVVVRCIGGLILVALGVYILFAGMMGFG